MLTKHELDALHARCLMEREAIKAKLRSVKTLVTVDPQGATDEIEEAQVVGQQVFGIQLHHRELFYLRKIGLALERMSAGTYGECEQCAEMIGFKRLLARPTAALCIICKAEQESAESKNSESLSHQSHPVLIRELHN